MLDHGQVLICPLGHQRQVQVVLAGDWVWVAAVIGTTPDSCARHL